MNAQSPARPAPQFDPGKSYTYGEMLRPAMEVTNEAGAQAYLAAYIEWSVVRLGQSREEAEETCKVNLGYFAGYYDHETRLRVERLFRSSHPVFGKAADGTPTAEEAFKTGVEMAEGGSK